MKMRTSAMVILTVLLQLLAAVKDGRADEATKYFLIGNSLTWDTVPSRLDGDTQWHVDCGKSLPFIVEHPEAPCVKTSTLWPTGLKDKQYDVVSLQVHYGSTLAEDVTAISQLIKHQATAKIVIHTGWARSAERIAEWNTEPKTADLSALPMSHSIGYFDMLLAKLRSQFPTRSFTRTRAMEMLECVEDDITSKKAPISDVTELYRDKIHMNLVTGRYLMHNAMRSALGQPRSVAGFEKLDSPMKDYLDSVLDRVLTSQQQKRAGKSPIGQ